MVVGPRVYLFWSRPLIVFVVLYSLSLVGTSCGMVWQLCGHSPIKMACVAGMWALPNYFDRFWYTCYTIAAKY